MQEKYIKLAPSSGNPVEPEMNPAEEAPPGLSGEDGTACPKCQGSGVLGDGTRCEHCSGTGKVSAGHLHT